MRIVSVLAVIALLGCDRGDGESGPSVTPVDLDPGDYTYTLEESTDDLLLWTAPSTHRVTEADRPPEERRSGLFLSAAGNEFEPVQLVLGPGSGTVTVTMGDFDGLGETHRVQTAVGEYVEGWTENLSPLAPGAEVTLDRNRGAVLWVTVYVPPGATAGEHESTLQVGDVDVPVTLYVYDFDLPSETHYATQLNVSVGGLVGEGGDVDDAKDLLFEHRFTPKSVTWPSGFGWNITWDNPASSDPCEVFWDEPDEPDQYAIGWLAQRYILGTGWNSVGFPNAMIFQFVDNSTPRPSGLCGLDRGDHYGTDDYNAEWSQWLFALDGYLVDHGLASKAYYYVQNEPQNDEDHRLAAYLCSLTRAAAPNLRIAVSEEPKPQIAEDPDYGCGYDIWIAHVRAYQQDYAWQRIGDHGEQVWLYSLDHDPDPYFNPTRVDVQGIHQRIIPWVSWSVRTTGWAYYDAGRFFDGPRPGVRAELLREGIEDYEYLYLANGGAHPEVFVTGAVDATAASVASGLTSWTRDADALAALRHQLGLYIEGSRADLPVLQADSGIRPRGEYHVNFQDPSGSPESDPLEVSGRTWMKVGWIAYDADQGLGWYGEYVDDLSIARYGFDEVAGYDVVQQSYVYDDYGRDNLFEFALENGRYEVTVGCGRPMRGYPGDPHNVAVEGIAVIDDEITTDEVPVIERTVTVDLVDGSLSVQMGGRSGSTGEWSYTFLSHLSIVPVD